MSALGLFRYVKLRTLFRSTSRSWSRYARLVFGVVAGMAAFGVVLSIALLLFSSLVSSGLVRESPVRFTAAVFTLGAAAQVLTSLSAAVYTLYLSSDVRLLMSMPIRERTIFTYKYWETLLTSSALFAAFGLPIVLAAGIASGAGPLYYPVAVALAVLVLTMPTSVCILLVMPLMRLIRAGRAKEIIAVLSGMAGLGGWAFSQWMRVSGGRGGPAPGDLSRLAGSPIFSTPPGIWAADVLEAMRTFDVAQLLRGLVPLLLVSGALYFLCIALSARAYAGGWARTAESARRGLGGGWAERLPTSIPREARAIAVKDLTSFPRDLRQLAGIGSMAVVAIVLSITSTHDFPATGFRFVRLIPYLIVAAMPATFTASAATRMIGGEGKAFWLYLASPIGIGRLLLGKWISTYVLGASAVLLALAAMSVFHFYLPGLIVGLAVGLVLSAAMATYHLAIGTAFARFDWENPKNSLEGTGSVLSFIAAMWLMITSALAVVGSFALSVVVPAWLGVAICAAIWLIVVGLPASALLGMAARRLGRMEWTY